VPTFDVIVLIPLSRRSAVPLCSSRPRSALLRSAVAAALALVAFACDASPVQWRDVRALPGDSTSRLIIDDRGVASSVPISPSERPAPNCACAASVVTTNDGRTRFAAWWRPRADSSAELVVARSDDGGRRWTAPVVADGRDRRARGCGRPPPAVAFDSTSDYVHVAYWMSPPEGSGVWYTHSMDGGATWHSPVGIAFGADPSRATVAAEGSFVVVVYESPNAAEGRIGLGMSHTFGHIIEQRIPTVSGDNEQATHPDIALRGRTLAVSWLSRAPGAADGASTQRVVRTGLVP
jgi:hypothetical protein